MPVYFARAKIGAVEKQLEPCRRLDLSVTLFMWSGRWFLPPGRCWTGARDHQYDYEQKTNQHPHVLCIAAFATSGCVAAASATLRHWTKSPCPPGDGLAVARRLN